MTTAAVLLAYEPEDVQPGWIALVLVLLLAVATFLLWRNMNKQLRKIDVPTRAEVREAEQAEQQRAAGSADVTDVTDPIDTTDPGLTDPDDDGPNGQARRHDS